MQPPDLNPIEYLEAVKNAIQFHSPLPKTAQDTKTDLAEEWDALDTDRIDWLIASLPRQLADVIKASGGAHIGESAIHLKIPV